MLAPIHNTTDHQPLFEAVDWLLDTTLQHLPTELAMATYWLYPQHLTELEPEYYWFESLFELSDKAQDLEIAFQSGQLFHQRHSRQDVYGEAELLAIETVFEADDGYVETLDSNYVPVSFMGFGLDSESDYVDFGHFDQLMSALGVSENKYYRISDYDDSAVIVSTPEGFYSNIAILCQTLPDDQMTLGSYTSTLLTYIAGNTGNTIADVHWSVAPEWGIITPTWSEIDLANAVAAEADVIYRKAMCAHDWLCKHPQCLYEIEKNYHLIAEGKINDVKWTPHFKRHLSIYDTPTNAEFLRFWRDNDAG